MAVIKKLFMIVALLNMSFSVVADEESKPYAEFSGEGQIKTRADYISLTFNVRSTCQRSPIDAQTATDAIVKKIDNYLQQLKSSNDKHFKILIDGGYTTAFSRWHKERELCRNTFQKNTIITLNLDARDDFDKTFSAIQNFVLDQFEQQERMEDDELAESYVTLSQPNPEITRGHRMNLERQALALALKDAKRNFSSALASCEPHRWSIFSIREPEGTSVPMTRRVHFYTAAGAQGDVAKENAAPVKFDLLEVNRSLIVRFNFDGSLCYEKAKAEH